MNPDTQVHRETMLRRAVLAGDESAWKSWCLETFDELDRFVLWRCGGRRDRADDIVQEAWLVAVRQIRRFDPQQGSFLAWLRGIAANVRRNHLRREQRRIAHGVSQNGQASQAASTVDSQLDEQDRALQITAALDALPERQEAVLRAKYFDDLSVADIAHRWKETPKAIESLLSRARQAMREVFERQGTSERSLAQRRGDAERE